jgi:hypothetical protein
MKKIFTLLAFATAALVNAQAPTPTPPVIEGTYYPVRNTSIKQVWDKVPGHMNVPVVGQNVTWNYSSQFSSPNDTFSFAFKDPSQTPYASYFPNATHSTYMRTPFNNISDSLYSYWNVNYNGLFNVGGYSNKHEYDSVFYTNPMEFYSPSLLTYLDTRTDTCYTTIYAKRLSGFRVKIKERKIKTSTYNAWGTLILPNGTYNNVASVKENNSVIDSVFIDWANNNNYSFFTTQGSSSVLHQFLRNNTFGSAFLMYLSANPTNTQVSYGWYTLPVDFGSISGSVYTSTTEATPITSGEAYLYRENSNFVRQDILAKAKIDALGNYKFDSIPYGEYRIAVRPTPSVYPNALITYYGDTTNWIDASTIITTTLTSPGHKIHVKFHQPPAGTNGIHGQIMLDLGVQRSPNAGKMMSSNPIPGVGIVVKRNPGSSTARTIVTDGNGEYDLGSLENGGYVLFVDIPGMHMTGTYSFNVNGTASVTGLDYKVGTDSIHPFNTVGIKELKNSEGGFMSAYPNPYTTSSTILLNMPQGDDMTLEVYNILGAKVATLDKGNKQAGTYTYTFGAKRSGFSAGVYFVKLTVGNKTDVIKIVEQ